ncbi:hypothetical protein NC651_016922 [Populus alba x Populus x berolinensis]|nr:hypothetical protein NC651_016922 [Populus alba x Populus x berolinensis]
MLDSNWSRWNQWLVMKNTFHYCSRTEEADDELVQSYFYKIPLLEVHLEAHRCTAEEEWLERWSMYRWRRRKAHCYWVAGWMRESFSQWQGTTLATVVIEVLVNKRKRERELSGGI